MNLETIFKQPAGRLLTAVLGVVLAGSTIACNDHRPEAAQHPAKDNTHLVIMPGVAKPQPPPQVADTTYSLGAGGMQRADQGTVSVMYPGAAPVAVTATFRAAPAGSAANVPADVTTFAFDNDPNEMQSTRTVYTYNGGDNVTVHDESDKKPDETRSDAILVNSLKTLRLAMMAAAGKLTTLQPTDVIPAEVQKAVIELAKIEVPRDIAKVAGATVSKAPAPSSIL